MPGVGQIAGRDVDVSSFHSFYQDHARRVTALAIALSGDAAAGEDLAQEAFTRAYQRWDQVRTYDDPGAWVRRVTANLSHSRWRRVKTEARALARLDTADRHTELTEPATEVWRAVRRLPANEAAVVALFYVEDRSVADIARILEIPEGTAKSCLHRARQRLARMLKEPHDEQ